MQLALNYNLVPNSAVLAATYAYDIYDNGRTDYANPVLDTEGRNKTGNVLGVKLYYATP